MSALPPKHGVIASVVEYAESDESDLEADGKAEAGTLWQQALQALPSDQRKYLKFVQDGDLAAASPAALIEVVNQKRADCEKKQWVLFTDKKGNKILLRDVMGKICVWADKFKTVVDNAVDYVPQAAIPWAIIKALTQMSINDCQTFGKMIEATEKIASIIALYAELETRLLIRVSALTNQLASSLVKLYSAVLQFLAKAHKYYAQRTAERLIRSVFSTAKDIVEEPMLHIESIEDDVYKRATIVSQQCGNSMVRQLLSIVQDNVLSSKATTAERRTRLCNQIDGIRTRDTLEAALGYHHEGTCCWALQLDAFKQWQAADDDTATLPTLLWIHGPPGFGKTITSAWLVHHLTTTCHEHVSYFFCVADNERTRDPYAILRSWLVQTLDDDAETAIDTVEGILAARKEEGALTRSELWSLFCAVGQARPGRIFLLDGFDECTDMKPIAGYHRDDPRATFLRELVCHLPAAKARVLVVSRDAADIREVLGEGNMDGSGVTSFEHQITARDTNEDVQSFSQHVMLQKLPKKKETLRQQLATEAADRSKGMFLWIQLLEKEISPGQNAKQLTATVQGMPSGISEAYARELERIDRLPSSDRAQAIMVLRWVLFAVRPLRVKELAEALVVSNDPDLEEYPEDDLPDEWQDCFVTEDYVNTVILGFCGSLLRLRSETQSQMTLLADSTVHFVHFSVKEYLCSDGSSTWPARLSLTDSSMQMDALSRLCLRYLRLDVFAELPTDTRRYPFLSYASWAWYFHSYHQRPPPRDDIMHSTRRAFDPASPSWKVWTPMLERELIKTAQNKSLLLWEKEQQANTNTNTDSDWDSDVASVPEKGDASALCEPLTSQTPQSYVENPVYYASLLGLTDVIDWLAGQGLDVDCTGGQYGFPLQAAAARGHNAAISRLLARGAPATQTGGEYTTALIAAAASCGDGDGDGGGGATLQTIQLLLDAGAPVGIADTRGLQALDYAAMRGSVDIVSALLAHGAAPTAAARRLACRFGHRSVLKLLDASLLAPVQDFEDLQAISTALECGYYDVVLDVIDALPAATVSALLADGHTLLHHAAAYGALVVVQKLLHHPEEGRRPDLHVVSETGWSALHEACASGNSQVVLALLEAGAEVGGSSSSGNPLETTGLQAAASYGHSEVIGILLAHGAEVNQTTRGNVTALGIAVETGNFEAVKTLVEHGASMRGIDEEEDLQRTLYEKAVAYGKDQIAEWLLCRGCFGEPERGRSSSSSSSTLGALLLAVSRGQENQQVLPQLDAAALTEEEEICEVLRLAAYTGNKALVAHLVLLGKKPGGSRSNAKDMNGRTALHYAATQGHDEICQLLLTSGHGSVGIEDVNGSTAIDLAVRRGARSAAFIKGHMGDLAHQLLQRRPSSLLEGGGDPGVVVASSSASAVRKALAGHWEGEYDYLHWLHERKDAWTLDVPGVDGNGDDGNGDALLLKFDSVGADLVGKFAIHGFVDPVGCVWFVKLYARSGWLYKGRLSADLKHMRGTWGSNRKLWHGTFTLAVV